MRVLLFCNNYTTIVYGQIRNNFVNFKFVKGVNFSLFRSEKEINYNPFNIEYRNTF